MSSPTTSPWALNPDVAAFSREAIACLMKLGLGPFETNKRSKANACSSICYPTAAMLTLRRDLHGKRGFVQACYPSATTAGIVFCQDVLNDCTSAKLKIANLHGPVNNAACSSTSVAA